MTELVPVNVMGVLIGALVGGLLAVSYCRLLWHQTQRLVSQKSIWAALATGCVIRSALVVGVLYWLFVLGGSLWLLSGLVSFMVLRWLLTRAVANHGVGGADRSKELTP